MSICSTENRIAVETYCKNSLCDTILGGKERDTEGKYVSKGWSKMSPRWSLYCNAYLVLKSHKESDGSCTRGWSGSTCNDPDRSKTFPCYYRGASIFRKRIH